MKTATIGKDDRVNYASYGVGVTPGTPEKDVEIAIATPARIGIDPNALPPRIAIGDNALATRPWQVQIRDEQGVILDMCDERLAKALKKAFWAVAEKYQGGGA